VKAEPVFDLEATARPIAAREAIRGPSGSVRYGQLADRVGVRADELAGRGVAPGSRVGVVCHMETETLVSLLALLRLGCSLLPLGPHATEVERNGLARSFHAGWMLDRGDLAVRQEGTGGEGREAASFPAVALPSSGSEGEPKLVLRSAGQIRAAIDIWARSVALSPDDRLMALVPLEHSYGFQYLALAAFAAGTCLVFPPSPHPRDIVRTAAAEDVTLLPAPPVVFDLAARHHRENWGMPRALRAAISVGSGLPVEVHGAFTKTFERPLWQSYGASEAGPVCLNRSGLGHKGVLALGEPCPGVEITVRNDRGECVSDGEVGELVVRSPAVALGYGGSHAGASRIEDGLFFTGDLGERRGDEFLFHGRRKLLIAMPGRKVDPLEVEQVLCRHPDVAEAAVVAHRAGTHTALKAILVARRPVEAGALTDFCGRALSAYKVPRVFEFRDALPRNAMGKVARHRL
jgi:long-chain acyl-CoA synthetase